MIPSGGGWRKATKFAACDGRKVDPQELLWRAGQVFEMEGLDADDGIGVFRYGINKKVPFYAIGGYHDAAGVNYFDECPDVPFEYFPEGW